MYRMIGRVLCALSLFAVVAAATHSAASSRFAASYQLSNVVASGDHVDLTIKLTISNPGDSDIEGGIVVLYGSQPGRSLVGSFSTIKSLPRMGQATTSGSFTISAEEYARWQQGRDPILDFLVPSPDGATAVGIQARRVTNPSQPTN